MKPETAYDILLSMMRKEESEHAKKQNEALMAGMDALQLQFEEEKAKDAVELSLEQARQQFTGFYHANQGYDAKGLCVAMGLTSEEWEAIREDAWIRPNDVTELDEHFNLTHEKRHPRP